MPTSTELPSTAEGSFRSANGTRSAITSPLCSPSPAPRARSATGLLMQRAERRRRERSVGVPRPRYLEGSARSPVGAVSVPPLLRRSGSFVGSVGCLSPAPIESASCGLGPELVVSLLPLWWVRRRRDLID